ncbi:thiamine biosynthesis protein ThiS [Pseudoclavibacter endophyticus]|uniref:MoaD/ThiS family protein n=1 Tax=Pseudoclavibacter endophyticus TaxID=1778590 RepID=A0A6H9WJ50_9MICO|nr:MoaD/ThiS family protein [Pseudoclavibacter endophyticus]KAB1648836.1 MoaD/ThiS family protein [Pseudoclavibacter endophyticus]GGA68028.1 thiamine biosynthesis protein ThiS [Pseudoclavibacter endophyticus]
MITVRFFAAAADAAGTESLELDASGLESVGAVAEQLADRFGGELRRVIDRSSFLLNGERVETVHSIAPGDAIDVLPPFAGG